MTEKFKIINDAGDYHLMSGDEKLGYDLCSPSMMKNNWNKVVDKLNKQDERIQELQQTIDTIAKDYEESHGMDIRNAEWFTAW